MTITISNSCIQPHAKQLNKTAAGMNDYNEETNWTDKVEKLIEVIVYEIKAAIIVAA